MSKPRKRVGNRNNKTCAAKQKFETREEAEKAAYRPPGRLNQVWGFMQAYRCRRCKKFHYGHAK